ncbi:telomere repeat-binding protein 5-like isoform X2 [Diospyros lotus]|uniref:telomere repeat-binding protein 5-like isoform X2 n=1 Tax=Diospyros lotus TaxID=55363 RepID=UPI00225AEEEE|nr:telomere repeat-binding protein 5-like isoform X2 [Diospyros lotus]
MVLKRLSYGFIGYQVPPVPKATRSARRRGSFRTKFDDNQMCPIELLITAAGMLERDRSPGSRKTLTGKELLTIVKDPVKKEQLDEDDPSKAATCNQGRCDSGFFVSKLVSQISVQNHSSEESSHARNDDCSGLASAITSDCSEKVISAEKLVDAKKRKIQLGSFGNRVEVASSGYVEHCDCTLEDDSKKQIKREVLKTRNTLISIGPDICSLDNMEVQDRKATARVSVDSSLKFPLSTDRIHIGSFPACRDDVKLDFRDDDENSSGYIQPITTTKAFWSPPRSGNRRIRKLLASKYWKVNHKLKGKECFNADSETKPSYHYRKNCYRRQRSQRDYPLKKRKLYHRSWVTNPDGGSRDIHSSSGIEFSCDASGSDTRMHGASGTSACVADTPSQARGSHVKLRIKSFKVPELFIEVPETASVGSLKRMVMEAVTAILGGGLQVGVLLQGKNIRDDNKTLLETGVFCDEKLDTLGFSLEPNPPQAPSTLCEKDHHLLLACNAPQSLTRYPPAPTVAHDVVHQRTADVLSDPPMINLGNFIESDHDLAPSPPDMSLDKSPVDCKALVAIPAMKVEALAAVPMRKSKRSEAMQRRIRRPFSVSEVEALVQAVEKLGTGRWRDVKLRAFDNSKHRTYVDLKDKWKTLVHTARISPQQRRGEPVPQELLDRVLTAHAYWTQHQAKQQHKHQSETCL